MALSGTLQDFGIADILQLIGHQTKTGTLLLTRDGHRIEVAFHEGNVVFATEKAREPSALLGAMLLRAELVTHDSLHDALVQQRRSLKRLGDILIERGTLTREQLAEITRLQTTETLYKLFDWKRGEYEFTQEEVDPTRAVFAPIRAEMILLEGFRRVDESVGLRRQVPKMTATFAVERPPPEATSLAAEAWDAQRSLCYRLAAEGRTVQRVVDASRLGEFDALKTLIALIEEGYLRLVAPARGSSAARGALSEGGRRLASSAAIVRLAAGSVAFAAVLLLARGPLLRSAGLLGAGTPSPRSTVAGAAQREIARDQAHRLETALELYRLEHGEYPAQLDQLLEGELILARDLRYPFREPYFYRRTQQGFVLLPPLD